MKFDNDASIAYGQEEQNCQINGKLLDFLFEEFIDANPELADEICIEEFGTKTTVSYRELNSRANKLARVLIDKVTSGLEENRLRANSDGDLIVALRFLPNIELIVTILALTKCGLAYVPIAPNWPAGRIRLILQNAKPAMVITNTRADMIYKAMEEVDSLETYPSIHQVTDMEYEANVQYATENNNLPANVAINLTQDQSRTKNDRLYAVLYTSGSTGTPKGARILHSAVLNRLMWQWEKFPYQPNDVCAFKTTLTFVDSISEIWGPLLKGVKNVIIPNKVTQNVELFVDALETCQVTRLFAVTSLIKNLLTFVQMEAKQKKSKPRLNKVYQWECSAEAVTAELVRQFFNLFDASNSDGNKTICNFYGSTEMSDVTFTAFTSLAQLEELLDENSKVPIGRPIFNSVAYVLDKEMQPVPLDTIGQLYISSANLCDGYVGTKHKNFMPNKVENPSSNCTDGVLYGTGDFVRLKRENGLLYYEGRCDSQIKVRGHRVDLSEIEKAVTSVEGVDKAVILCYKPNEPAQKVLCFFSSGADKKAGSGILNEITLEEKLRSELPCYMLPKPIKVPVIPSLVNGKVDRQALLQRYEESRKSTFDFLDRDLEHHVSSDHFERGRLLLNIVAQTLGCTEKPSLANNFFDIGGDSINMVQIISRCFDFGYTIGITDFSLANNLAAIVNCMQIPDATKETPDFNNLQALMNQDVGDYYSEPLQLEHREIVVDMISRSFADKGDLTTLANVTYDNISEQVDVLFEALLSAGLSVVIKEKKNERIIGACLNFDARSKEAEPLCACAAFSRNNVNNNEDNEDASTKKSEEESVPMSVVEFLDAVEEPLKDQHLPEAKGKTIYASLLGTAANLTPVENVKVTLFMEMENIRYGKLRGYEGIFTTNANRLTQHISRILGYQILSTIQVNQYEDYNGSRPFAEAPDDLVTEVALKWFD